VGRYLLAYRVCAVATVSIASFITLPHSLAHSLTASPLWSFSLHLYSFDSEFIEQISWGTERCRERTDPPMAQVRSRLSSAPLLLYSSTPLLCYCATASDCGCGGLVLWRTYSCCICVVLCACDLFVFVLCLWMYTWVNLTLVVVAVLVCVHCMCDSARVRYCNCTCDMFAVCLWFI
jgi:hypothetical protein